MTFESSFTVEGKWVRGKIMNPGKQTVYKQTKGFHCLNNSEAWINYTNYCAVVWKPFAVSIIIHVMKSDHGTLCNHNLLNMIVNTISKLLFKGTDV